MARSNPARRLLFALLAGALSAASACDSEPKVYPVTGKVINKGKGSVKDMAGYNVQFRSTTDPTDLPGGVIEEDGSFTIYTYTGVGGKVVPGVKAGTYQACVQPPPPEGGAKPKLVIPVRYTQFETANLQFTIKPGPNEITIEVDRNSP